MTSTDKDLSLTPLKGNSGKAYMGTYPNGDRVFVKMNTTPILAALAKEQIGEGLLWLGIIAISVNLLASLVIRKGQTKNESILSLHFLEDTLGWLAVILMAIVLRFTDWYILDPLLSLAISFFILSKAIPRFWSTLKIFLDAVPEGVDIKQVKNDLEQLDNVASINQLNLWTMDGLEKNAIVHICLEHVKHIEVCKESIRDLLKESGFQNVTIEVDEDLATHRAHKRNIEELEAESEQQHHH